MQFRFGKALLCLIAALPLFAQDFAARHLHAKGYCQGFVKIAPDGISYSASGPHAWTWKYQDIQRLEVSPESLRVFAFEDHEWREITFTGDFARAYLRLKDRMDQRLVARLADEQVQPLWTLAVKQVGRVKGTQGELIVGGDRIVYKTGAKDASRTWRYSDIESISSSGPFQLTVTTVESSKGFSFQLKEALKEEQYNNLRRRLNRK